MRKRPVKHDRSATVVTRGPATGKVRGGTTVNKDVVDNEIPTVNTDPGLASALNQMVAPNQNTEKVTAIVDRNGKSLSLIDPQRPRSKVSISGMNLSGYDLRTLDWKRVKEIKDTNLDGALISHHNLELVIKNSSLCGTTIEGESLYRLVLEQCDMRNARFIGVKSGSLTDRTYKFRDDYSLILTECDFSGSEIINSEIACSARDTNMSHLKVNDTKMSFAYNNVNATSSEWKNSRLIFTFWGDQNKGINLSDAHIENNKFLSMRILLQNVVTERNRFKKREVNRNNSPGLKIVDCHIPKGVIWNSDLGETTIQNSSLQIAFDNVQADNLNAKNNIFDRSEFLVFKIQGSTFAGSSLKDINFGNSTQPNTFQNCDFSNTNFDGSTLGKTIIKGCNWKEAQTRNLTVFKDAQPVSVIGAPASTNKNETSYEEYTIEEAAKRLSSNSNKNNEELLRVLHAMGGLEMRCNFSKLPIKPGESTAHAHVPVWQYQNLPQTTKEN